MHAEDCQIYFNSQEYANCGSACRRTNQKYQLCCVVFDYCSFHRTTWFFWMIVALVAVMVMVSVFGSVYSCLQMNRRGGGRGDNKSMEDGGGSNTTSEPDYTI